MLKWNPPAPLGEAKEAVATLAGAPVAYVRQQDNGGWKFSLPAGRANFRQFETGYPTAEDAMGLAESAVAQNFAQRLDIGDLLLDEHDGKIDMLIGGAHVVELRGKMPAAAFGAIDLSVLPEEDRPQEFSFAKIAGGDAEADRFVSRAEALAAARLHIAGWISEAQPELDEFRANLKRARPPEANFLKQIEAASQLYGASSKAERTMYGLLRPSLLRHAVPTGSPRAIIYAQHPGTTESGVGPIDWVGHLGHVTLDPAIIECWTPERGGPDVPTRDDETVRNSLATAYKWTRELATSIAHNERMSIKIVSRGHDVGEMVRLAHDLRQAAYDVEVLAVTSTINRAEAQLRLSRAQSQIMGHEAYALESYAEIVECQANTKKLVEALEDFGLARRMRVFDANATLIHDSDWRDDFPMRRSNSAVEAVAKAQMTTGAEQRAVFQIEKDAKRLEDIIALVEAKAGRGEVSLNRRTLEQSREAYLEANPYFREQIERYEARHIPAPTREGPEF